MSKHKDKLHQVHKYLEAYPVKTEVGPLKLGTRSALVVDVDPKSHRNEIGELPAYHFCVGCYGTYQIGLIHELGQLANSKKLGLMYHDNTKLANCKKPITMFLLGGDALLAIILTYFYNLISFAVCVNCYIL